MKVRLAAVLAVVILAAPFAVSDTIYSGTQVFGGDGSFSFSIPENPTPSTFVDHYFETSITNIFGCGSSIIFFTDTAFGGFNGCGVSLEGPQLFSGPTSSPTMLPVNSLYSHQQGFELQVWHITSTTSTTPVPEPSTTMLLGSGLIGIAGFRRRFSNN
jgi:hypothetical protein